MADEYFFSSWVYRELLKIIQQNGGQSGDGDSSLGGVADGTGTLVDGRVVINDQRVTAASVIIPVRRTSGTGGIGQLEVVAQGLGTFTIESSDLTDDAAIGYIIANFTPDLPPIVNITEPVANAVLSGDTNPFIATVSDDSGDVQGVQFFIDGVSIESESTASPYSANIDTSDWEPDSTHLLSVIATDAAGNASPAVNRTVIKSPLVGQVVKIKVGGNTVTGWESDTFAVLAGMGGANNLPGTPGTLLLGIPAEIFTTALYNQLAHVTVNVTDLVPNAVYELVCFSTTAYNYGYTIIANGLTVGEQDTAGTIEPVSFTRQIRSSPSGEILIDMPPLGNYYTILCAVQLIQVV